MGQEAKRTKAERVWLGRIEAQQASGLSAAAWCRKEKVSYSSFIYWRRRLRREEAEPGAKHPAFQEIVLADGGGSADRIVVCLAGGASIRVPTGVDRETLRLVLEETGRC